MHEMQHAGHIMHLSFEIKCVVIREKASSRSFMNDVRLNDTLKLIDLKSLGNNVFQDACLTNKLPVQAVFCAQKGV